MRVQALAFIDLETSGSTPTQDRITEVGIITLDAGRLQSWSSLVNPQTSIPPFIENLTGITNEMVADAPLFEDLIPEILDRLMGRIFVAHNARFDYGFIKQSLKRAGIDFRATTLCTVKLSRKLFPEERKHNLDSLVQRHGLVAQTRHRALADADLIAQFWLKLTDSFAPEVLDRVVTELTARPSLPTHLGIDLLDELPEKPGVYLFYGENDLPLYVGKSKNIRERVLSHFSADVRSARELSLSQQIRRVDWIETGGEVGALLREAALVKQLQPTLNRQLRLNRGVCSLVLGGAHEDPQAVVRSAQELDPGRQDTLYGLFESGAEAQRTLRSIAEAEGLCLRLLGLERGRSEGPCFAHQLKRCRGACVGDESREMHHLRLTLALSRLKIRSWPFEGPATLKEGDEVLVVDRWVYLGSARSEGEVMDLLESGRPQFDKDSYRILSKVVGRMTPLTGSLDWPLGPLRGAVESL